MANLHDLAESLIGDHMPDKISSEEKQLLEDKAMNKIVSMLPTSLREKYLVIWNEYNANRTISSKFVHNMDKLEMALQAKEYESQGYSKASLEIFFKSANDYITSGGFDLVYEILQSICNGSDRTSVNAKS